MNRSWYRLVAVLAAAGGIVGLLFTHGNTTSGQDANDLQETQSSETGSSVAELSFPLTLPESGLLIEGTVSYSGAYMEDGSGDSVSDVTGLMVYNPCERMVRFGAVALEQDGEQLYFFVYCLPPGGRCLILEKNRHPYTQGSVTECRQLSVRWEYQNLHSEQVYYVGFGEELTLVNHSPRQLRHVTLWYKCYDPEKECYLGGVAYSAHVFRLHAQEQRVLTPEHYNAGSAKVVTVELDGV